MLRRFTPYALVVALVLPSSLLLAHPSPAPASTGAAVPAQPSLHAAPAETTVGPQRLLRQTPLGLPREPVALTPPDQRTGLTQPSSPRRYGLPVALAVVLVLGLFSLIGRVALAEHSTGTSSARRRG